MQPVHGSHSGIQNLPPAMNDPRMRAEAPKPPTAYNEVIPTLFTCHSTILKSISDYLIFRCDRIDKLATQIHMSPNQSRQT